VSGGAAEAEVRNCEISGEKSRMSARRHLLVNNRNRGDGRKEFWLEIPPPAVFAYVGETREIRGWCSYVGEIKEIACLR
jgi:hypothetical protein